MQKRTHLIFALLLFSVLNFIFRFPVYLSVFAFIGSVIPDFDFGWGFHRKIFHNLWFLALIIFFGFNFHLIDRSVSIIICIGFVSHLIMDSLTKSGVMPFWPVSRPHFRGPIRTGGISEYIVAMIILLAILWMLGIVRISI